VAAEHATDDTADRAAGNGVRRAVLTEVGLEGLRQYRNRHALQPDRAGPGERDEVIAVGTEELVGDTGHAGDLKDDRVLEDADMAGVHEQGLPSSQVIGDGLAGEFDPCRALAFQTLEHEPVAAPQASPKALLQADGWA